LFVATSAVSTTGLVSVSVAESYSFFGQLVVLILIQLGGIGYMTLGSFVILVRHKTISPTRDAIGNTVFSLPESFRLTKFLRTVITFTIAVEAIGAVALYYIFVASGAENPVWNAIFHSISAFCTAGFGLYNDSFMGYTNDFWMNAVLSILSLLGAIGFIVFADVWRWARGKSESITLTSHIILNVTLWLAIIGTSLLFLTEPSIQDKPADQRLLVAFFQCMTAMTTVGFNSIDIGTLSHGSILVMIVLMIIGASPSGTGGGIKSTTLSAILGTMVSAMRGQESVTFWGIQIPSRRISIAYASLGFYLLCLIAGTFLLNLTESSAFDKNLFEAASAIGTVGLSMGITAGLTNLGKIIIILLMFTGRLGPLTLGIALYYPSKPNSSPNDGDLAV